MFILIENNIEVLFLIFIIYIEINGSSFKSNYFLSTLCLNALVLANGRDFRFIKRYREITRTITMCSKQ